MISTFKLCSSEIAQNHHEYQCSIIICRLEGLRCTVRFRDDCRPIREYDYEHVRERRIQLIAVVSPGLWLKEM